MRPMLSYVLVLTESSQRKKRPFQFGQRHRAGWQSLPTCHVLLSRAPHSNPREPCSLLSRLPMPSPEVLSATYLRSSSRLYLGS